MNSAAFQTIADLLGRDGTNYVVLLDWYETPRTSGTDAEGMVRAAVGSEVVIEDVRQVSLAEVLAEVAASLCYAGDSGAGPGRSDLQSTEFRQLLASVIGQLQSIAERSDRIEEFRFKTGHPHYPVFWDFAFLFSTRSQVLVFVGSSSD